MNGGTTHITDPGTTRDTSAESPASAVKQRMCSLGLPASLVAVGRHAIAHSGGELDE